MPYSAAVRPLIGRLHVLPRVPRLYVSAGQAGVAGTRVLWAAWQATRATRQPEQPMGTATGLDLLGVEAAVVHGFPLSTRQKTTAEKRATRHVKGFSKKRKWLVCARAVRD